MTTSCYLVPGWGAGWIASAGDVLLQLELPHPGEDGVDGGHPLGERIRRWFAGARDDFADVELDLDGMTPLWRSLLETLRGIPYGETVTYGELAALAGRPRAARAAGTFCARNRFGLVVPCHRVVSAGGIGAYGSLGVDYKRRLLELEGVGALR